MPERGSGTRKRLSASSSARQTKTQTKLRPRPRRDAPISNSNEKERTIVILYNKPPNIITSHESQDSRLTVYDDIQSMRGYLSTSQCGGIDSVTSFEIDTTSMSFEKVTGIRSKLHAIGRLDADTTGLLLLTNDGRLVNYVTNPDAKIQDHELYKSHCNDTDSATTKVINKTYEALIMGHHTEETLRPLRNGVDIGKNYVTKPLLNEDDLQVLEHPNHKSTVVSITIGEGKNRQVRKMFHAIGSGVMKLKRTRIGEHLTLGGLNEGEWRILTDDEVQHYLRWNPREIVAQTPTRLPTVSKKRHGNSYKSTRRRRRR